MYKRFIVAGIVFAVLGIAAFCRYMFIGTYVDENGMLVESFGYIPLGILLLVVASVCWFVALLIVIRSKAKNTATTDIR